MNNNINLTDAAANKIYELISAEGNYKLNLRIYIEGGGCSGFQYGFAFDKTVNADDTIFSKAVHAVDKSNSPLANPDNNSANHSNDDIANNNTAQIKANLIVDALSLPYLDGATIDYVENLRGANFTVQNPNAKTTCGCGSSFSLDG